MAIVEKYGLRPRQLINMIETNLNIGIEAYEASSDKKIIDIKTCDIIKKTISQRQQIYDGSRAGWQSGRGPFGGGSSDGLRYETIQTEVEIHDIPADCKAINFSKITNNFLDNIMINEDDIKSIINQNKEKQKDNISTLRYRSALKIIAALICNNGDKRNLDSHDIASIIERKTEMFGERVTDDTVRSFIDEIKELFAQKS